MYICVLQIIFVDIKISGGGGKSDWNQTLLTGSLLQDRRNRGYSETQKIPYKWKKAGVFTVKGMKHSNMFPRNFLDPSAVKTFKPLRDFKVLP